MYADERRPLVLLRIDASRQVDRVKVETLDNYPERFPHLYGSLPVADVLAVEELRREDGLYRLPAHWTLSELVRVPGG